jgi:hypothetical protein
MRIVREGSVDKFKQMRDRARREVRSGPSLSGNMGTLKSFGELSDSILKLRENFDILMGKQPLDSNSPLKKKDLMNELGFIGGS